MGYYTRYTLRCDDPNLVPTVIETFELHAFEADGEPSDETKWYDHDQDMKLVSEAYPENVFILHGEGEENDDMWRAYYKNGKVHVVKARIVFDEFDPEKLANIP